jgi:hypothetical protein
MMAALLVALLLHAADAPASQPAEEDELARAMREASGAFSAPASAPAEIKAEKSATEVNGYVSNRLSYGWNNTSALVPIADQPQLQELLELNLQLRRPLWRDAFAYVDASAYLQAAGDFVKAGPNGERENAAPHDVATFYPEFILSEAYVSYSPIPNLNLLVGKKRVVWGAGLAFNPTDLLNPPKDPTDPNLQRAGAYLARVEMPFDFTTLTFLAAPKVIYQDNGLPYQFLVYPNYASATVTPDPHDNQAHYLLAARWYMLLLNSDLNLMYFFSNAYADNFHNKSRLGLSFSRYFFTDYELHVEALMQEGTNRQYVNPACIAQGIASGVQCYAAGTPLYGAFNQDDGRFYARVLVGSRRVFVDESQLSIEYLYVGDGLTPGQFKNYATGLALAQQAPISITTTNTNTGGLINRFTLDPLRRHYLFLNYSKPKIFDDWTVGAVVIAGLEDLSGLVAPSVTWNTFEWLNLQITGFIPVKTTALGADIGNGKKVSEYSLVPFDWRVLFEARFFY